MATMHTVRHFILAASALLFSHAAYAQSTTAASELLAQGKAKQAYQLLLSEEADHAGDPDFDYLLGRSALDSGEYAKATLIFERVLAVSPNHAGARLDMGRAYFALGDFSRAKSEFESLQSLDPPPAAKATIDNYLAAIEQQQSQVKTRFKAYAELTYGRDSNVTAGPTSDTVYLPLFGLNFRLGQTAQARSDNYHQINAGGELTHALDARNSLFVAADLRLRNFNTIDSYDQLNGELRAGWIHSEGANNYRLFVSHGELTLGHSAYRKATSLGADWRHNLNPRTQLSLFAQTSRLRYIDDALEASDYDQHIVGGSWTQQPVGMDKLLLSGALFVGSEIEARTRTDGNKHFVGARAALMYKATPTLDLYATTTLQYGKYSRENILYTERRRDKQFDLSLGANWKFAQSWSLRPQISRTRNYSNTSINAYERIEGSLTVRKDF